MPRWILGCFAAAVMLSGTATAGPVAPNEVCIYEHADYVGPAQCFHLEPVMRHKLEPTLGSMNDRVSSIHVGEGVNVFIYKHAHFGGDFARLAISHRNLELRNFNDIVSSLIIVPNQIAPWHRKHAGLSGVELQENYDGSFRNMRVFYPLPEHRYDYVARYPNLDWNSMNDVAYGVILEGNVVVTLYEHANFKGKWIRLPGVGEHGTSFFLDKYQFDGIVSSLEVRQRK